MVCELMCPHCGKRFSIDRLDVYRIPDHAYPRSPVGGLLCPGSGQAGRNPETDRRPLWKDLPGAADGGDANRRGGRTCDDV